MLWRMAKLHQIRTVQPNYSFELNPQKDITQIVKPEVGDIILLRGDEMSSAGYKWTEADSGDNGVYRVVDTVTEAGSPDPQIVGGASKVSIRLEIVGEGEATAVFKHMQPFGDGDVSGSFTLQFE